ncbi:MAG: Crp/Fnr family transcriptional regulator [Janthinobacterium lividum]
MAISAGTVSVEDLRACVILQGLPPADLDRVRAAVRARGYVRGETVIEHQDTGGDVFLLFSGQLLANRYSAAGREISYRRILAGSYFGELAAFDGQPRSVNVVALSEARVGCIPARTFRDLIDTSPSFAGALLADMASRVRELSNRLFEASAVTVPGRVDAELIRLAIAAGVDGNRAVIAQAPTHAEFAALIGGQRETVTRALGRLADLGIVVKRGRDLVIADVEALIERVEEVGG